MPEHDAGGAAREEAARQLVWVAVVALALPVLAWWERQAANPDAAAMAVARVRAWFNPPQSRANAIEREVADFRRELSKWNHPSRGQAREA